MSVKSQHADYEDMATRWKQCRDSAEGEHAIHEAGELYLPKLSEEKPESYALRRSMTPWFNATWRTISGLRGMMFRKPPAIEVPTALDEAIKDIDLAGTTLQGLAQDVAIEALTVGRVGLLVDYPVEAKPGMTKLDAERLKLRASIAMYKTESIINWREKRVNGSAVLSMVVLKENAELPADNEFEIIIEERYRVLDLVDGKYRQRVFKVDKSGRDEQIGDDMFPLMGNKPLDYIPFVFIGVDCVGPKVEAPPLIDLVTMNFKHYGQATSYERGCFFSGLPSLFISGHGDPDTKIYIGGSMANILPQPDSKAYFVEVQSEFNALRTNLLDKQQAMAVLGARMLESQKAGVESGDAIARRQTGEESLLSCMSQTISMGVTVALKWLAAWEGVEGEVKVELNRDFLPASMDAQTLTAMVSTWQSGGISYETLFHNLKAGEIIEEGVTMEQEQGRISEAAPVLMGAAATA